MFGESKIPQFAREIEEMTPPLTLRQRHNQTNSKQQRMMEPRQASPL
jgi:hypothetical protein